MSDISQPLCSFHSFLCPAAVSASFAAGLPFRTSLSRARLLLCRFLTRFNGCLLHPPPPPGPPPIPASLSFSHRSSFLVESAIKNPSCTSNCQKNISQRRKLLRLFSCCSSNSCFRLWSFYGSLNRSLLQEEKDLQPLLHSRFYVCSCDPPPKKKPMHEAQAFQS